MKRFAPILGRATLAVLALTLLAGAALQSADAVPSPTPTTALCVPEEPVVD